MIIETDFPDHWKTQLLIKLTQDPAAPLLMIRFWAFCQQRRSWRFANLSNEALAAICRWTGDAAMLRRCLIEAGFLDEEQQDGGATILIAHDFDSVHSTYVANWKNGALGGRPKTHSKPNENPTGQLGKPSGEERRGEEGLEGLERSNTPLPPSRRGKRGKSPGAQLPDQQPEPIAKRMLVLNAIFNRQTTTAWTAGEMDALHASGLLKLADADFADAAETVVAFYHADIPREMEKRFWRRTGLQQLLNGWAGEEDKARLWARERERMGGGHKLL